MQIIDFFLHLDKHIEFFMQSYGIWGYGLLFLIIFCETGLVFMPFLPGDSLIFAAAALSISGGFNIWLLVTILLAAAVLGDTCNYMIGHKFGEIIIAKGWIKQQHLDKTHAFYQKYGNKMITLARFVPIVRTFAPFVAGVSHMDYKIFALFNILGAVAWVGSMSLLGYFFGNLPVVRDNFSLITIGIILISVIPMAIEFIKFKQEEKTTT